MDQSEQIIPGRQKGACEDPETGKGLLHSRNHGQNGWSLVNEESVMR